MTDQTWDRRLLVEQSSQELATRIADLVSGPAYEEQRSASMTLAGLVRAYESAKINEAALDAAISRHPAGKKRDLVEERTFKWDRLHDRPATVFTPPEDIIELPLGTCADCHNDATERMIISHANYAFCAACAKEARDKGY